MIVDTVTPLLAEIGFKKRGRGNVYTLELATDVIGWLGLNQATRHRGRGEVEVNPVVGVRFQRVEQLVAECRGEQPHDYIPPTIRRAIGYVMPEKKYRAWVLAPGAPEDVASEMIDAIATHGLAFMRSTVDLAALRRRIDEGYGIDDYLVYRRPVAALLAGDPEQARASLEAALASLRTRTDDAAAELRNFVHVLRTRISSHDP